MRTMSMMILLALFCGPLLAEDLILKDGRYLQVKILEHNESGVRVRNLANGGLSGN